MADDNTSLAPVYIVERSGFLLWSTIILSVLGAPFFLFIVGKMSGWGVFALKVNSCSDISSASCSVHYLGLNWLAIGSCAALFGAIGVMLSLVLRRRMEDYLIRLSMGRILVVVYGVGAIFAILMLALFIGGFLQGNLFPGFTQALSWVELNFRLTDWGKLIIWAFLAGFSERLVPTLFDQLIDRVLKTEKGNVPGTSSNTPNPLESRPSSPPID